MRIDEIPPIGLWHYYTTLTHHTDEIRCLRFTTNGAYMLSAGWDHSIGIWDLNQNPIQLRGILIGHTDGITDMIPNNNNESLASVSKDGTIRLWDLKSRSLTTTVNPSLGKLYCIATDLQYNFLITGGEDRHCHIWEIQKDSARKWVGIHHLYTLSGPQATIHRIIVDGFGREIICMGDEPDLYTWQIDGENWRQNKFSEGLTLRGHIKRVFALTKLPNSLYFISGGEDKTLRIWDSKSKKCIRIISTPTACSDIWIVNGFPQAITSTIKTSILLWNSPDWTLNQSYEFPEGKMQTIAISSNGKWLAIAPFGTQEPKIWLYKLSA